MSTANTLSKAEPGNPWLALVGIALPGAGHWLLGERHKAIAIAVLVHAMVIGTLLSGAAVAPPVTPDPMFTSSLSQTDPIGSTMRLLESVAQRSNGIAVWGTLFFGYKQPFTGSFTNAYISNLLSLAGILNLLATFYLFDERRKTVRERKQVAAPERRGKKR